MNINPGKTEFSDAELAALRTDTRNAMADDRLTQAEVCRQSGVPSSSLSQFLSNSYPGDNATIASQLDKWLKARAEAADLRRQLPKIPAFQPLSGSKTITAALAYARETGRMVLIAGNPGVSKTATARQFKADYPRTWYTAMDPSTRGVPTMLLEILAAMGVTDARGTPQQLMAKILKVAAEAKGLICIDEAQHLSELALEALRAINDRSRETAIPVGVALLGNEVASSRVGPTGTKSTFAQVSSRFAQRRWIVAPNAADAAALAQAWAAENGEVITKAEIGFCLEIAAKPGGLRNIEMTMEAAILAARGAEEPLSISHLKGAFSQLSGVAFAR
ncbi:AAA family ATPase [Phenylobacterium ferrooxidans]|uniref:AAA family ATPase n=1 Tax=Phenylobacterium ferrooxidans TaxID=2982689 RepID=A0ABW6CM89_9CAUL